MKAVEFTVDDGIAIVTINNPPVNALGTVVRQGLARAIAEAEERDDVEGIVITASGRSFIAGADIKEFGQPPRSPSLPDVISAFDSSSKPIVAAIHGAALGGGFEVALGCDARIVSSEAIVGLPEVRLGLLPGAGGTQRLPRLVEPTMALDLMLDGEPLTARAAVEAGIADALVDRTELIAAASKQVRQLAKGDRRSRLRDRNLPAATREAFEAHAAAVLKKRPDEPQIAAIVDCVRAAYDLDFDAALATERAHFQNLRDNERSKALRYVFFAERASASVAGVEGVRPRDIASAAVIGGGTMGSGIAVSLINAGISTVIIEVTEAAAERARTRVEDVYHHSARRGSLTEEQLAVRLALLDARCGLPSACDADLIVEAAFEDMAIKKDIFSRLSTIAKPGAVLATNTSYLDVNEIAVASQRPGDVLGLHFFSPANVMKLIEIVRGERTTADVLKTGIELARRMGKVSATVGVCHGFVGNRMLSRRSEQLDRLLMEGALPHQIDAAIVNFGFRMGPCAMSDLAGLDIGWRMRQSTGKKAPAADAVHDAGRLGQKNGRGYYRYPDGARIGVPDPEVETVLQGVSAAHGVQRRDIAEDTIVSRLILPMINEGARILEEGIVSRASDIDVVWLYGYNWPRWRGGPMYHADQIGLSRVVEMLDEMAERTGIDTLRAAPLLRRLAESGQTIHTQTTRQ